MLTSATPSIVTNDIDATGLYMLTSTTPSIVTNDIDATGLYVD